MSTATTWPITIEVDSLPPSPNRRMGWQKRWRLVQSLADAVAWQAKASRLPRPLERARVQLTLVHARGPLRDPDNAIASCKELLDALVRGGLLVDDGPDHVELAALVQVLGARPAVCIEVWPAGETAAPGPGAERRERDEGRPGDHQGQSGPGGRQPACRGV
jgi:hypothetical protein